jgi:hypothetical protein
MLDQRGRLLWAASVMIAFALALAFGSLVYGQSRMSVSPDLIKTMLVSQKRWILYWDRGATLPRLGSTTSARSPSLTIEFMRVGVRLVGYAANDQVHHAECEFEVTVNDTGFMFTGCWGSEKSMTYDPADRAYPFKGRVEGTLFWLAPFHDDQPSARQ